MAIATLAAFAVLSAVVAIASGWLYLVGAVLCACLLIGIIREPGQLRRRLATLDAAPSASPAPPTRPSL